MAGRTLAGALGLTGDWDLGENNWKDANDLNLLKLSVTVQGRALELVSATPGAPTEGVVYLFNDTHPTQAGKIAVYDEATWKYITPSEGWRMWDVDSDFLREFNGSTWVEVTSGGGGGGNSPFRPGFFFEDILTGGERYGKYVATSEITFPANFAGASGHCETNPAATFVIDLKKNGVAAGTVSVSTGGAFTFATAGGAAVVLDAGDRLTVHGPAVAGTVISGCGFTLDGEFT